MEIEHLRQKIEQLLQQQAEIKTQVHHLHELLNKLTVMMHKPCYERNSKFTSPECEGTFSINLPRQ